MNSRIFNNCFSMPSVRKFTAKITDRLSSLNSCLVLLPETIPTSPLIQEIRNRVSVAGLWHETLAENSGSPSARSPLTTVLNAVGAEWQSPTVPRTIRAAPDNLFLPDQMPDVLFIDVFHSPNRNLGWKGMHFLPEWAGLVKNMKDRGKRMPSICQVIHAKPDDAPPEEVLFYKVFHWWGFPSALELQIICEVAEGEEDPSIPGLWKKMILPWLSGSDIALLGRFLNEERLDWDRVNRILTELAVERQWDREAMELHDIETLTGQHLAIGNGYPTRPSSLFWSAWARGILGFCPDYGAAVSPVALKVVGMEQELLHRCWRAQCGVVLPVLDRCRLRVCQHLTRKYGNDWPLAYLAPIDQNEATALKNSSYNCQYGHLETVIFAWPELRVERGRIGKFINKFRKIRNELAHNRPISYWDFKQLMEDVGRFQKAVDLD